MHGSGGATEVALRRLSRRYVVVLRTATLVIVGVAALAQAPADRLPLVAAVVVGLCGWSVVYARRLPVLADTIVVVALCLAQGWLVRPDALPDITNWVLAIVWVTAVGHQWFTAPAWGALLAVVLVAAYVTGGVLAAPAVLPSAVAIGMAVFGGAGMSRLLWFHLFAAARRADHALAASERAGRDAAVAAARRADEREHLAVLHDTAAATLLAVGTGMVEGTEPWLAEQAARDLAALATRPAVPDGAADLAHLLGEVARQARVTVRLRVPDLMPVPAAPASAIGAAAREALTNVARHAGVDTAHVVATRAGAAVVVEVTDDGGGFARNEVPPHRRGLAESIERRMSRVGGRAVVTTRPGGGTVVRLEWPG
jgi:signal transduction histidine kinase